MLVSMYLNYRNVLHVIMNSIGPELCICKTDTDLSFGGFSFASYKTHYAYEISYLVTIVGCFEYDVRF